MNSIFSSSVTSLPRLRPDLVFSKGPSSDGGVAVKDPLRRKYFRLGACELFIARQLDGETPMDEVRRRAEAQFGAVLTPSALEAFTGALRSAGLLDDGSVSAPRQKPLIHGSLLRIQIRAFDPDRLLESLSPSVSWCFSRKFVISALLTIGVAALVVLSTWSAMAAEGAALLKVASIPVFVVVIFALLSAHEFAHGLTCKHYGGAVHEMGFMLIYFQPAFYCDVSDAWLIPDRWKRVWVSAAGPFLELTLWACATLVWIATDAGAIHRLALVVMACTGAHSLLNFNPFIKLDGYYILSDILAIPNLRRRAFAYVGSRIKRLAGIETPDDTGIAGRERLVFLMYGMVASVGTFALLVAIIGTFGASMLEGRQPLLFGLTIIMVGLRFRRRFRRLFGGAVNLDDEEDDGGIVQPATPTPFRQPDVTQPPKQPQSTSAAQDPDAERAIARRQRRRAKQRRRRAVWAAAAIGVIALNAFGRSELKVPGPFTVLPEHNADVRSGIEGVVDRIHVTEGETVRAGDTIATLSARETRGQLEAVAADIERAGARLRLLELGVSPESIALAQTVVLRAQDALRYAQARLARIDTLEALRVATKVERETGQEQVDVARSGLAEAESKLKVLQLGARPEEIQASRAELAKYEAQRQMLSTQLRLVGVRSPASGVVATPERELRELPGQLVSKGALLAKVYELRALDVEIAVPEKDIGVVTIGQPVLIRARAYPGRSFSGKVVSIAPAVSGTVRPVREDVPPESAPTSASGRTILVTTVIENAGQMLKPGMTGQAKILCGQRPVYRLMLRRFLSTFNLQVWSWV